MIAIYALIFRILSGEKYAPPTKQDTKVWLALLASVPPMIGVAYLFPEVAYDWPLFFVWLGAVAFGCCLLVVWFLISRLPGLKSICALAVVGWAAAFATAFYMLR